MLASLTIKKTHKQTGSDENQTLGGYGYLSDFPVERICRDGRVCQIYEGASDVKKIIVVRGM
jgi:butyryl-CoA dehydrogenase